MSIVAALFTTGAVGFGVAAGCAAPSVTASAPPVSPRAASLTAAGAPGTLSRFDLARKDCLGTAMSTTSKVWYTVADGVLSDVYSPTVDNTNVETMQYVVTDGHSFTDLQTRDLTYTVSADPTGMACTVLATSAAHGYQLLTTYVTDPARDAVVAHTTVRGTHGPAPHGLTLYIRLDAHVNGNGGGGQDNGGADSALIDTSTRTPVPVAYDIATTTQAANRDYAAATFMALSASGGFTKASVGYAGTASDGLTQLDTTCTLGDYTAAPNGHVVLTARIAANPHGELTLALGFGRDQHDAISVANKAATNPFAATLADYTAGWRAYDARLRPPPTTLPGFDQAAVGRIRSAYYLSVNVVKASEDKTFPGAIVASLASPWGQAVSAGDLVNGKPVYFGSYREVFSRDLYEAFTALLLDGDLTTARDATRFLLTHQQLPDGRLPRNSLLNGKIAPDTNSDQLDETSYPIVMAWQSGLSGDTALWTNHLRPAADFLVAHGPAFGVERWEEQSGYSPSTIAAEIAGLTAASAIAGHHNDTTRARLYQATADHFQRHVKDWTLTTAGPYRPRYFLRLSPTSDPNAASGYNLGNGAPKADQRQVVDAGFLELVRLGELPASDPDILASLKVVDATIRRDTPNGVSFYRYGTSMPGSWDGYGDCYQPGPTTCTPSGRPWPTGDIGSGHLWPVLSGERGEQELQTGDTTAAAALLVSMQRMSSGVGLEPEQDWEDPPLEASPYGKIDPTQASIGFAPGHPAGSASPLTWAQAQLVRLALAVGAGRPLEQPTITRARYVDAPPPGTAPLSATVSTSGALLRVTGRTTPGANVDLAVTDVGAAGASTWPCVFSR
ncbi:MAG: glucan 1,4-alpha-glucosidase [Pseudonocardiales bacterium]|nr:glucan 1,4-alpha-glucosidase [Pseudonocardiales bacterium]